MSILVVDDNPINFIIIEEMMKKAGYSDFIGASSAEELFQLLPMHADHSADIGIDLILMDMMMPGIDGIEACRRIQQVEGLKDIPIIIVTAIGDSQKLAEALDAGAVDYVTKPINKVELLARIRSALRLKEEKDWHKERDIKLKSEMELAKLVQSGILSDPMDNAEISIHADYRPSAELAGDLYTWYRIDQHKYGIILLDMMGHGISSSLVCMFISSVLKDTITLLSDPVKVVKELNRYMSQLYIADQLVQYYFTAIYLLIDTHNHTIEYVNAGHPPGVLLHPDGSVILLDQGSCAVGFFPSMDIEKGMIEYGEGAKIILYTDGLLDLLDGPEEDKLEQLVNNMQDHHELALPAFMEQLIPLANPDTQNDDMCLLKIQIKGTLNDYTERG